MRYLVKWIASSLSDHNPRYLNCINHIYWSERHEIVDLYRFKCYVIIDLEKDEVIEEKNSFILAIHEAAGNLPINELGYH
jgi:hypothetical protein